MLPIKETSEQLTLFGVNSYLVEPSRFGSVSIKNDSLSTQYQVFEFDSESSNGAINIYSPGGTSRGKNKYFRYSYRDKTRMVHVHIPGKNINSLLAKKRAALVQCEIEAGRSPKEIVEFIKSFGRTTR